MKLLERKSTLLEPEPIVFQRRALGDVEERLSFQAVSKPLGELNLLGAQCLREVLHERHLEGL